MVLLRSRRVRDDTNIMESGVLERFEFAVNYILCFSHDKLGHYRPGSHVHEVNTTLVHSKRARAILDLIRQFLPQHEHVSCHFVG